VIGARVTKNCWSFRSLSCDLAFSTASAPVLTSSLVLSMGKNFSQFLTQLNVWFVGNYIKLVCNIFPACSLIAATTGSGQCPAFTNLIPPAKSISSRPSASIILLVIFYGSSIKDYTISNNIFSFE
jgi:hypothetical protein